ncbi:MAG: hypothetical protein R3F45_12325 [Gammaproteobacteria bacterium]
MADLDWVARRLRLGGAMGRALALLSGFLLMLLFLPNLEDDPVVQRTTATGIVALQRGQVLAEDARSWVAAVRLPDGRHVRLMFFAPRPRDGMAVPLVVEHRRSGAVRFVLDVERWRAQ